MGEIKCTPIKRFIAKIEFVVKTKKGAMDFIQVLCDVLSRFYSEAEIKMISVRELMRSDRNE